MQVSEPIHVVRLPGESDGSLIGRALEIIKGPGGQVRIDGGAWREADDLYKELCRQADGDVPGELQPWNRALRSPLGVVTIVATRGGRRG